MDCHGEQSSRVKLIAVVATFGFYLQLLVLLQKLQSSSLLRLWTSQKEDAHIRAIQAPYDLESSQLVAWLVAMIFYVVGLVMIIKQGNILKYQGEPQNLYNCNAVKPGIFGAGASFALTSILLEIIYLVATTTHQPDKTTADPPPRVSILGMC
ncbi:hypothetical protein Tco_1297350 [Tanacetum coccineum]